MTGPVIVIVLALNDADIPVGNPLEVLIPVAPVVAIVMEVILSPTQTVGEDEGDPAVLSGLTVTSLVAVASEQPPLPLTVYVIVDVPALWGVMAPVEASTVATPVLPLVHVPPLSPLVVNVVEPFEQIPWVPLNVPASGAVVTVTSLVAVASEHGAADTV